MDDIFESAAAILWLLTLGLCIRGVVLIFDHPAIIALAAGVGLIASCGFLCAVAHMRLRFLASQNALPGSLARLVRVTVVDDRLSWSIHPSAFTDEFKLRSYSWRAVVFGIAVGSVVILLAYHSGAFDTATSSFARSSAALDAFVAAGVVAVMLVCARSQFFPIIERCIAKAHHGDFGRHLDRLLSPLARANGDIRKLQEAQREIEAVYGRLGLAVPKRAQFLDTGLSDIADRVADFMSHPGRVATHLQQVQRRQAKECATLTSVVGLYEAAIMTSDEVGRGVQKAGDRALLGEYERLCDGLFSDELRTLVANGNSADFSDIVGLLVRDLETLRYKARASRGSQTRQKQRSQRKQRTDDRPGTDGKMTVQTACAILGVPQTATPQEISKAFRRLAAKWHPDTGRVKDDRQMKRLTEAYAFLKRQMQFA